MLLSCKKYEIETLTGNQSPDEVVVTSNMKEAFVNRLYITLIGRKATPQEFLASTSILGKYASKISREELIDSLSQGSEYTHLLYDIARADYLESVDTAEIRRDYNLAVTSLQNATGASKEYWQDQVNRLDAMLRIPEELNTGMIDIIEVHRRVVNNPYYDDINMGTENFVVACFQNFLFRYPTNAELLEASNMVDGFPGSVFLQSGSSKNDFLDIFFSSDDYFEGQVINLYKKYLFRNPTTAEASMKLKEYQNHKVYQILQKDILSSDEYFFN